MNLINILFDKSDLPPNTIALGGSYGLWDVARDKIIIFPIYLIYVRQAKDKDLKKHLNARITAIQKQIETIQKFFKDRGFDAPKEPVWKNKVNDDSPFALSSTILDDEEIAMALREHLKNALGLETEALRNATLPDVRELIYEILKEDNKTHAEVLKLQKEKGWTDFTPTLMQQ